VDVDNPIVQLCLAGTHAEFEGRIEAALGVAQARAEQLISCAEASGGLADREQLRACARAIDPDYP
jgi:hypothetical protein